MRHAVAVHLGLADGSGSETIPLISALDFHFSGTSNTNSMSDYFPRAFNRARDGKWEEAMDPWWQVAPAGAANVAILSGSSVGTTVINRTGWKYQEWLAGFNGGALRAPAPRIPGRLMKQARVIPVEVRLAWSPEPSRDRWRRRFHRR